MKILGGEYKNGVITVSIASAASMTAVAGHELGHYLAQNYAEEYKELSRYVQTALEAHGESIAARVLQVQALYERQTGQKLDYDEAVEEIVNNALFSVDIKSTKFETFIKEHTTLAQRILDAIHELLRDLSAFFKTATGIKEVETLRGDLEYMQEVAERVEEILGKAQKNSTTAESGVRYMLLGTTADGIEVYETSEENKNKSYAEKLNIFAQNFITPGTDMYIGNSISYIDGNGNKKVAYIDRYTKNKNIGNINPGRLNQWDKAKINAGAEDDFVRISSNGKFSHNEPTRNTLKNDVHKKTSSFDYTIKTIWLDGRLYEINANIRNDKNGKSYVYFVDFTRKKEDPQRRHQLQLFMQCRPVAPKSARSSGTSTINVTQQNSKVKNNKTGSLFLFP